MTREELIDELNNRIGFETDNERYAMSESEKDFYRDILNVLEQESKTEWIPVSERLPKDEGLYLVSVKNDHQRRYLKCCWFSKHGNWFSRQDVIAWMPLPKPYSEVSE